MDEELTVSVTVTKQQLEMLDALVRLGVYGETREEVVLYFFVRELDRVIADNIVPNFLRARTLLSEGLL